MFLFEFRSDFRKHVFDCNRVLCKPPISVYVKLHMYLSAYQPCPILLLVLAQKLYITIIVSNVTNGHGTYFLYYVLLILVGQALFGLLLLQLVSVVLLLKKAFNVVVLPVFGFLTPLQELI